MSKISPSTRFLLILVTVFILIAGCAGPGPKMFPPAPVQREISQDGRLTRWYDTDGDGQADFCEKFNSQGLIYAIGYDNEPDGKIDDLVVLDQVSQEECRHLILILDSIPYQMINEFRKGGRLRYFPPPSRVISPFPIMTDVCLSDFFGVSPCPGMEATYYDGQQLTNPYDIYLTAENAPWHAKVDYRLEHIAHPYAYIWPKGWTNHELRRIRNHFLKTDQKVTIGYVVGSSGLGAVYGRTGHQIGLVRLDRFCQALMHDTRGRAKVTMFSDHGHFYGNAKRIRLAKNLKYMGYNLREHLEDPDDVVVPEFGLVTCAAIYTQSPQQVATDVLGIEGMALSTYEDDEGNVMVLSRTGKAKISNRNDRFKYQVFRGDPLELKPTLQQLDEQGKIDQYGFVSEQDWFEATKDHQRPDAVCRLWQAFHGLIEHEPDVLVTTRDGYFCGSPTVEKFIELAAAHGNLRRPSSIGFAISMAGKLPPVLRMKDLRKALGDLGVMIGEKTE